MLENLQNKQKNRVTTPTTTLDEKPCNYDMVVFCHLRWQFVYQRPQHLISRMSENMKILLIEEPLPQNNESTGNLMVISENLHVLQPNVKDIESIPQVIGKYVKSNSIAVGWFYSAAFSPLLELFNFETVVYDCMDELSLFKGAPTHLINQEKYLIANADIIFTGGKSLYESKSTMHPNVYCFPSSVDEPHFAKEISEEEIPSDIAKIAKPVAGYFGVIDERIDLQLLHETALKTPEVSFVMIGPLAKIGENDLPQADNIHYLGMKNYNELPLYLKAFDIAMMPFALNDATKYISPTKTLEYMAAGKPIISTKITDVVRDYSSCVSLIDNPEDFSNAIQGLLKNTPDGLQAEYKTILKNTSWNNTAAKMSQIIKENVK